jgi:hypothetical protein
VKTNGYDRRKCFIPYPHEDKLPDFNHISQQLLISLGLYSSSTNLAYEVLTAVVMKEFYLLGHNAV